MSSTICLPLLSETTALAARSHAPQLIDIDGTVFVQLGLFLVLVLILNQFLWKPYLRVRQERVTRVDGYRKDAAQMEVDAADRLARVEARMADARRVGSGERAAARAEAQAFEQKLLAGAQSAAQRTLKAASSRLDATVAAERVRLEAGAAEIAAQAATRILGRQVTQ
jgi:F-type H+-transporting ATPase subunit b